MNLLRIVLCIVGGGVFAAGVYSGAKAIRSFRDAISACRHAGSAIMSLGVAILAMGIALNPNGGPVATHPQQRTNAMKPLFGRLIAATLTLAGSTLALGAQPAAASVGCWGDYCSGKNPVTTNCIAGAYAIASSPISHRELQAGVITIGGGYVGEIKLMWSPTCRTNWARLNLARSAEVFRISAIQETGYTQTYELPRTFDIAKGGIYDSPIIYSPVRSVRAQVTGGLFLAPRVATTSWG